MRNLKMSYYNVYYYCNIIDNLLHYFTEDINWVTTGAQFTEPFFEGKVEDFPKYSALHQFCDFAVRVLMQEDAELSLDKIEEKYNSLQSESDKAKRLRMAFNYDREHVGYCLEVDHLLAISGKKCETFFEYLLSANFDYMIDSYVDFVTFNGDVDEAVEQLSKELFYILFQNREFLQRFNYYLASANPERIKRCNIPAWVKRAVMHRERGKCAFCRSELSGLIDCEDTASVHYDHIVPLKEGGLNDVSNIQLLCRKCNLEKSAHIGTSEIYKDWYDFEDE